MKKSSREIELKYLIDLDTFLKLKESMQPHDISDAGHDHFWDLKYPNTVAFLRFRERPKEITIKIEDGQGVTNRVEMDFPILRDFKHSDLFKVFGAPEYSIFKAYFVWLSKDVEISLYHVDKLDQYFLEVEATTLEKAQEAANHLQVSSPGTYKLQTKSLFTLVKEKTMEENADKLLRFYERRR